MNETILNVGLRLNVPATIVSILFASDGSILPSILYQAHAPRHFIRIAPLCVKKLGF